MTIIADREFLRVVPSGRRLTFQLAVDADLLSDLMEDVVIACYEAGVSSVRVHTRQGKAEELMTRSRRLRERLQGMFTTLESEGSITVEISGDPFRSVEQALSVTLQSLVRALRRVESDLSAGRNIGPELEDLLKDCAGYASTLKRMVSQMVAVPDEQTPFYAISALMEASSNMAYLVREVEESVITLGRQELASLIHLAEVLDQLSGLVVELRNSVVVDQLMDLVQTLREVGRKAGPRPLLRRAEDLMRALIKLNALMVIASEGRTGQVSHGPTWPSTT